MTRELTATDVDVNHDVDDDLPDEAEQTYTLYELDEAIDLQVGESIDEPIVVEDVEYVVGYEFEGPVPDQERRRAEIENMRRDDDNQIDIPDQIRGARLYHGDEDGNVGVAVIAQRDATLDDVIETFEEDDDYFGDAS